MPNPLKWWFNRKPYRPAILDRLNAVEPSPLNAELATQIEKSAQRSDIMVRQSRNMALTVVGMHGDLLRMFEGK